MAAKRGRYPDGRHDRKLEGGMPSRVPLRHLSIRVPWHDPGWAGVVCKNPKANAACLALDRIRQTRKDNLEMSVAGKLLTSLPASPLPSPSVEIRVLAYASSPRSFLRSQAMRSGHLCFARATATPWNFIPPSLGTRSSKAFSMSVLLTMLFTNPILSLFTFGA